MQGLCSSTSRCSLGCSLHVSRAIAPCRALEAIKGRRTSISTTTRSMMGWFNKQKASARLLVTCVRWDMREVEQLLLFSSVDPWL